MNYVLFYVAIVLLFLYVKNILFTSLMHILFDSSIMLSMWYL